MVINFFIDEKAVSSKNPSMRFAAEEVARKSLVCPLASLAHLVRVLRLPTLSHFLCGQTSRLDESGFHR